MYIASTPLRISLFGGSTDSPRFIDKYGRGSVISLSCNLRTYVTLAQDVVFGYNQDAHKYVLNYSKREEVDSIKDVKNDLIKVVLDYFDLPPVCVTLMSDVYSQGSGLASSSSYLISLIKAATMFKKISLTDSEICALAYELEIKFNPYCGYQDPYGCGISGFKKIEFTKNSIQYEFLSNKIFDFYEAHLVFTGLTRNSAEVLESVAKDVSKSFPLLEELDKAYNCLIEEDYEKFLLLINKSWEIKKNTSNMIIDNNKLKDMDAYLKNNETVIAHKLCGAGNGGFFLVFSKRDQLKIPYKNVKVEVSSTGINGEKYGIL